MKSSHILILPDLLPDRRGLSYGGLDFPLFLHEDVAESISGRSALRRRFALLLQQLAAHGRTNVVKGCRDAANRGWRRTPLGGTGGMQYYLWWSPAGGRQVPSAFNSVAGQDRSIWVRAVRHHDDMTPLGVGNAEADYFQLHQGDIDGTDDAFVDSPWTEQQLEFVNSNDPVRIVYGYPGSGKTTSLWRAVESRNDERVLYISWSRELVEFAGQRLATFAPSDIKVISHDFVTLVGAICRYDIPRLGQEQSIVALSEATGQARIGRATLGPWADRIDALYAEIRAALLGMAVDDASNVATGEGLRRLADQDYLSRRGGRSGVGPRAAESLLEIVELIDKQKALTNIFPELAGASNSLDELRAERLPEGFSEIDRVVVDEAQDLTLVEISVFVELCRAIARLRGYSPSLLIAGDEGQTVRPSGFDWGSLNRLLADRLTQASEFPLEVKLRAPERISAVIENASAMYASLARGLRPSNQRNLPAGDSLEARLFHVEVSGVGEALDLIGRLSAVDNLAIVVIDPVVPNWIQGDLRSIVLTPQAVKGLEYQSVCVLNPGLALSKMMEPVSDHMEAPNLDHHLRRTSMDRFRVALSRSTEALAFIDVGVGDEEIALSRQMLRSAVSCNADDLVEYLSDEDVSPEERVLARIRESRELIDANPAAAWNRATQALNLLGRSELPNGVADFGVRTEALENALFIGSRILFDGSFASDDKDEVKRICLTASDVLGSSHTGGYRELVAWTDDRGKPPLDLLDAFLGPDGPRAWLGNSLSAVYQTLQNGIETAASNPHQAGRFHGEVQEWLELSGFTGDVKARADELRITAYETLLELGKRESAVAILQSVDAGFAGRTAAIRESERRWLSAVLLYERSGMDEAAKTARSTGVEALVASGESMMESESYSEALEAFSAALALDEDNLEALDFRGQCLYELEEYERAIADYTRVLEGEGSYEDVDQVYYGRALAYRALWRFDLALADCVESIRIEPDDVGIRSLAAQLCLQTGRLDECMEHLDYAMGLASESQDLHFLKGACHLELGNLEQSLKYTLKARDLGEADGSVELKLGEIYSRMRDFGSALAHMNAAVELRPDWAICFYHRSYVHYETGEYKLALDDADMGLNLDPEGSYRAYRHRAYIHMTLENFDHAIEDCTEAISRQPDSVELYCLRMQANYHAANFDRALRDAQAAIRLGCESEELYMMMGHIYMCMMRPDQALQEGYERALGLNPDSIAARSGATTAHMIMQDGPDLRASIEGLTALERLLSAAMPPWLQDEMQRMILDSSTQSLFPMPRSRMPGRPDNETVGESQDAMGQDHMLD